jgi:hypothetical protein
MNMEKLAADRRREGYSEAEIKGAIKLVSEFREQLRAAREHETALWRDQIAALEEFRREVHAELTRIVTQRADFEIGPKSGK